MSDFGPKLGAVAPERPPGEIGSCTVEKEHREGRAVHDDPAMAAVHQVSVGGKASPRCIFMLSEREVSCPATTKLHLLVTKIHLTGNGDEHTPTMGHAATLSAYSCKGESRIWLALPYPRRSEARVLR
jgi:hypothetical protein